MKEDLKLIKGIGPKKEILLKEGGVFTIGDLSFFYPRKYEDRSKLIESKDCIDGEYAYLKLRISKKYKTYYYGKNKSQTRLKGRDSGEINLIWYNQSFASKNLELNREYKFYGIYSGKYKALINPIYTKLEDDEIGRIYPIYKNIKGISNRELVKYIGNSLDMIDFNKDDIFSEEFIKENNIYDLNKSLRIIHHPEDMDSLKKAISHIQIRDLLVLQLAKKIFSRPTNKAIQFKTYDYREFMKEMDFSLTEGQIKAFNEIHRDMTSKKTMNRLLQGDVGSGKTIVSILASLVAIKSSYQVCLMAPTEILAKQHFNRYGDILEKKGISSCLLTGNMNKKDREDLLLKLSNGSLDMVFGTHAIIQGDVKFNRLGLVIFDEQQRFGVNQRKLLSDKGEDVDTLILSATPIPRTLALSIYGDLKISEINESLPNRKKVDTFALTYSYEKRMFGFLRDNINNGGQVYVVCPAIDRDSNKANVMEIYDKYRINFPSFKVSYLHGKMDPLEKEKIMDNFLRGEIDILISTTVIEVGIDVSNANIMVIYGANNFGLSQLHQLRGRVGRGERKSYCILLEDKDKDFTKIKFLEGNHDGFSIAQKDLEFRGAGEIFGTKQHGMSLLKDQNLYMDKNTLEYSMALSEKFMDNMDLWNDNLKRKVKEEIEKFNEIVLN